MKKILLLLVIFPTLLLANPVNTNIAQQVAENFINTPQTGTDGVRRAPAKPIRLSKVVKQVTNNQQFYIFQNTNGEGYVIVSADDIAQPILGFSDKGNTENIPDNMRWWLSEYDREIQWAIAQGIEPDEETLAEWQNLTRAPQAKQADVIVAPLIKTGWSQSPRYNNKCPYDSDEQKRCLTGCVATAMAQVMKYWEFPEHGYGSYSYTHSKYGELSADFENTYYDWDNMPNTLGNSSSATQINAIATLMYHCGVAVNMKYGTDGSSANSWWVTSAFQDFFGYSDEARLCSKDNYSLSEWENKLQLELLFGRPLFYGGRGSSGGHAFICDGWRSDDYYHFNWGWGEQDGYYSLSALKPSFWFITTADYTSKQEALLYLYPQKDTTARCVLEMENKILINDSIPVGESWFFAAEVSNVGKKKFEGNIYASIYDTKHIGDDVYSANELVLLDSLHLDSLSRSTEILFFDIDSAILLPAGVYHVIIQYRDETSGELLPIRGDYYDNFKEVVVYHSIELGLTEMFAWRGSHEHWYTGDTIRFITEIRNHESTPFTGDITVKLVNTEADSIYQFFETGSCAGAPIPAHGDTIASVDAVLNVPAGEYDAYILYRNSADEDWKMVGCAPGFINPGPLTVENPPLISEYYIVAKRSTGNYYFLTPDKVSGKNRLVAVDAGTSVRASIDTINTMDDYLWTFEDSKLKNHNGQYLSCTAAKSAVMADTGIELIKTDNSDGSVTFTHAASETETWYFSFALAGNDYFVFYANANQITHLLMLPKGNNSTTPVTNTEITPQATKILQNGQIYILRGEKAYTVTGQEVK